MRAASRLGRRAVTLAFAVGGSLNQQAEVSTMPISDGTYERVALEDPEGQWELVCGQLRRRPGMTAEHAHVQDVLDDILHAQLHRNEFAIRVNTGRLRISTGTCYVPDLCVIPRAVEQRKRREGSKGLEIYAEPMPLVVEVWSPSAGEYDVEEKLREYQWRRDLEIWRIHPYEKTLTAWRLQPDGTYSETLYRSGAVEAAALPAVRVDLESLFD
jgi:Uma2 family endonuclease